MTYLKSALVLAAVAVALSACKKEEVPIGEPFSKVEGLTATDWVFDAAFLVDLGNPAGPERDVTKFYLGGDQLRLNFEQDGTFTSLAGTGLNPFPANGTWSFFPDDFAPREIRVDDGTRVIRMPLAGPTRISDSQLRIRFVSRECPDPDTGEMLPVLGYRFVFNRVN